MLKQEAAVSALCALAVHGEAGKVKSQLWRAVWHGRRAESQSQLVSTAGVVEWPTVQSV